MSFVHSETYAFQFNISLNAYGYGRLDMLFMCKLYQYTHYKIALVVKDLHFATGHAKEQDFAVW